MPDEVQFRSPTSGKVQAIPPEHWEEAMGMGYVPTTHKVMYSPEGARGMVPNGKLKDYVKQGYQTTPQTSFEQNVTGQGISSEGVGTGIWDKLSGMVPPAPTGDILSKEFWIGNPTFDPANSGIAQMGREAANEYQRSRKAGSNPLAAAGSAGVVGAGSALGVSDQEQRALAEKGEGGQIIGQSAVPAAMAALPLAAESIKGIPGRVKGAMPEISRPTATGIIGAIRHPWRTAAGWTLEQLLGKAPPPVEGPGPLEGMTSTKEPIGNAQLPPVPKGEPTPFPPVQKLSDIKAAARAEAKAAEAARKGGMTPPPFAGATSSAMPIGNAPLPEVPQGSPTPFPTVQPRAKVAAAGAEAPAAPNGESGIPTFGKTLYQMGEEPNLANPQHVKILKVLQTRSGPDLRALANQGDRFAAFVLRTMPRP